MKFNIKEKIKPSVRHLVLEAFDVSEKELVSTSRKENLVEARKALSYLERKYNSVSANKIAKSMKRNHTSILHYFQDMDYLFKYNRDFTSKIESIEEIINFKPVDLKDNNELERLMSAIATTNGVIEYNTTRENFKTLLGWN